MCLVVIRIGYFLKDSLTEGKVLEHWQEVRQASRRQYCPQTGIIPQ